VSEAAPSQRHRILRAEPPAWALVLLLTAVAVVVRAVFLSDQSLGYEEAFTAQIVEQPTLVGVWHSIKATESTPPLYYVLTWLWLKLAGSHGVSALRMTSLLAGSLSAPVSFLAARPFVERRLALVVAWLCAISPVLVSYSIYARSYALLVLTAALSVWALGALLERRSARRWALWALACAALIWTHYFGAFLVAAEAAVLFFAAAQARRALAAALAGVAAATAPLWPVFLAQSDASERTAYIASEPLGGRLEGIVRQFAMGTNVPTAWLEGAGIAVVGAAVLFALVRSASLPPLRRLAALALGGAVVPLVGALSGIDDKLLARNLLGLWICVAPLAAYGLMRLRALPLAVYSVICLVAVIAVESNWRYQGSTDWRGASEQLRVAARGEPIAVEPGLLLTVAAGYLHRAPLGAPLRTMDLWVAVQPVRGAGERALNPVADPPLEQLWGSDLRPVGEIDYHGFRLIHLHASTPVTVAPAPASNGPPTMPLAFVLAP
jgi:4-amino-4-deoxy-L-arabinose transferase-like glycosyltransferase